MAKRELLKKLDINSLKSLACEQGVDILKKKKDELVYDILTCQAPAAALTPIVQQSTENEGIIPSLNIELPPFNKATYNNLCFTECCLGLLHSVRFMTS